MNATPNNDVLLVADVPVAELESLLRRYGLELRIGADDTPIVGSFWGECEAGIVGRCIHVRRDTPIHSFLHECCHVICMSAERRLHLHRDAGSDDLEESAVCYLQILLADSLATVGRERLMHDMDAWGYSFRLGSTSAWFERDADDARQFLLNHGLITDSGMPTFTLRS